MLINQSDNHIFSKKILNQIKESKATLSQIPGILTIEGLYDCKAFFFIITDFKKGGDLYYHLKRFDRFSEQHTFCIVKPIIKTVLELHKTGRIV